MDDQIQEVWSEEPSGESGSSGFVHINLRKKALHSPLPIGIEEGPIANKTHSFPTKLPDWSNLEVIHRNTLQPRASFFVYDSVEDALTRDVSISKTLSLSGRWKFFLSKTAFEAPSGFFEPTYNTSKWGDINIPGMWQLQGYGKGPQ